MMAHLMPVATHDKAYEKDIFMRIAMIIPGWDQHRASDFDNLAAAPGTYVVSERRDDHSAKKFLISRATGIPVGQV